MRSLLVVALLCSLADPALALSTSEPADASVDPGPAVTFALDAPDTAHREVQLQPLKAFADELRPRLLYAQADEPTAEERRQGAEAGEEQPAGSGAEPPTFDPSRYPRVRGIHEETRVFWYAAGASALTSLVVRVLAAVPAMVGLAVLFAINVAIGPAATLALGAAGVVGLFAIDAAIAGLASSLVYDQLSDLYSSSYIAAFSGQFLGNTAAFGVGGMIGGFGLALILGTFVLTDFIGEVIPSMFLVFSIFGLIPAVVVGFFASVALPALLGAWAVATSAEPREGLIIDPGWDPLGPPKKRAGLSDLSRREAAVFSPRILIPGT